MRWTAALLVHVLLVMLAAHGLQCFVTTDKIGRPLRAWLARQGYRLDGQVVLGPRSGLRGWAGRWAQTLFTCPYCLGAWLCFLLWPVSETQAWMVVVLLAVRGLHVVVLDLTVDD